MPDERDGRPDDLRRICSKACRGQIDLASVSTRILENLVDVDRFRGRGLVIRRACPHVAELDTNIARNLPLRDHIALSSVSSSVEASLSPAGTNVRPSKRLQLRDRAHLVADEHDADVLLSQALELLGAEDLLAYRIELVDALELGEGEDEQECVALLDVQAVQRAE